MSTNENKTVNLNKDDYSEEREATGRYPDYPYESYPKPIFNLEKRSATGSFICGLMSIIFCFTPIFPLIMSVLGLFLAHEDKRIKAMSSEPRSSSAVAGIVLSVLGLIINIVIYVLLIILVIFLGTSLYNKFLA